jgi:hypothetical protein
MIEHNDKDDDDDDDRGSGDDDDDVGGGSGMYNVVHWEYIGSTLPSHWESKTGLEVYGNVVVVMVVIQYL